MNLYSEKKSKRKNWFPIFKCLGILEKEKNEESERLFSISGLKFIFYGTTVIAVEWGIRKSQL